MPMDNNFKWENQSVPGNLESIGCLAEYGGPAFPYVTLGGFRSGEDESVSDESLYLNATALVLTFLVNNKQNKSLLGPALDWEKEYVAFSHHLLSISNCIFTFFFFLFQVLGIYDELDQSEAVLYVSRLPGGTFD